mgnify:CR=1 FL=1
MNRLPLLILPLIVPAASATYGTSGENRHAEQVDPDLEIWRRWHRRKLRGGGTNVRRAEGRRRTEAARQRRHEACFRSLLPLSKIGRGGVRYTESPNIES